jgi:hypothetical protein
MGLVYPFVCDSNGLDPLEPQFHPPSTMRLSFRRLCSEGSAPRCVADSIPVNEPQRLSATSGPAGIARNVPRGNNRACPRMKFGRVAIRVRGRGPAARARRGRTVSSPRFCLKWASIRNDRTLGRTNFPELRSESWQSLVLARAASWRALRGPYSPSEDIPTGLAIDADDSVGLKRLSSGVTSESTLDTGMTSPCLKIPSDVIRCSGAGDDDGPHFKTWV